MKRLIASILLSLGAMSSAQANGVVLDEPVALPSFSLVDHYGAPLGETPFGTGWSLVMLGFTHCPDVCPFTMANLEAVHAEMGLRIRPDNLPKIVFLSVDPDRDTPNLAAYVEHFHPDFSGATGARDQIDSFVEATDSFYRFVGEGESYDVQHSSAISVIAPDGTLRAKLQPPLDPGPIAEFLARLQIAYRREQTQ